MDQDCKNDLYLNTTISIARRRIIRNKETTKNSSNKQADFADKNGMFQNGKHSWQREYWYQYVQVM